MSPVVAFRWPCRLRLRWLGGESLLSASFSRCLLPDVCGCGVSRNTSAVVFLEAGAFCLPRLLIKRFFFFFFFPNVLGWITLKKFNTEKKLYVTKFVILSLIFWEKSLSIFLQRSYAIWVLLWMLEKRIRLLWVDLWGSPVCYSSDRFYHLDLGYSFGTSHMPFQKPAISSVYNPWISYGHMVYRTCTNVYITHWSVDLLIYPGELIPGTCFPYLDEFVYTLL